MVFLLRRFRYCNCIGFRPNENYFFPCFTTESVNTKNDIYSKNNRTYDNSTTSRDSYSSLRKSKMNSTIRREKLPRVDDIEVIWKQRVYRAKFREYHPSIGLFF